MKLVAEILNWIKPESTNTEPTYYKSTYTATGSLFELEHFNDYINNYNPNQALNLNADKAPASS